jgi:23S rRNA (adenine2503-C2)-methyltransferase
LDLFGLTKTELEEHLMRKGLQRFRATQLLDWVYKKGKTEVDEFTNWPKKMRERYSDPSVLGLSILPLKEKLIQNSLDGTKKALLELKDGELVETVYIPESDRATVCFSSQVGCKMGCNFCATGKSGFSRDLEAGEIVGQLYYWQQTKGLRVTNAVAMGQGEPLDNWDNFLKALYIINDADCLNLGARHLTVSTCGIVPGIKKMAKEPLQVNLSVSLHAPTDELRSQIMPINRRYPLKELMEAIEEYIRETNRRVTLEYTVIPRFNDGKTNAALLIALLKDRLVHVNVIPVNPQVGEDEGESLYHAKEFVNLIKPQLNVTLRRSRGADIDAACGQLRRKVLK